MILELLKYGEVIWKYGSYILVFWVCVKFVNEFWKAFNGKLVKFDEVALANMKVNKEIAVIIKETQHDFDKHRKETRESNRQINQIVRNTLEMSNGGNPFIKKILERLDKIEETP